MSAARFIQLVAATFASVAFLAPLAIAGSSSGGYRLLDHEPALTMYLSAPQLGRPGSEVEVYSNAARGDIARIVIFVPARYTLDLARPAGASVGRAAARDVAGNGAIVPLTAASPSAHAGNPCAPGAHEAVWEFSAGVSQVTAIPVFVDRTTGADTALGAYKLELCLPPAAALGINVRRVNLALQPLVNPTAAGTYTWRSLVTPYIGGVASQPNTFEVRARVPLPMQLTLRAKVQRRSQPVVLSGRYVAAGSVSGFPVELWVRRGRTWRYVTSVRTDHRGRYSFRRRVRTTSVFGTNTNGVTDCATGSTAPAGCINETITQVFSPSVRVRPRR